MPLPHSFQSPIPTAVEIPTIAASAGPNVDWHQPATVIDAFVHGLDVRHRNREQYQQPASPATVTIGCRSIGICRTRAGGTMSSYPAGTITRCDDELWVQTGRGHLVIERIVVDGRDCDAAAYFVAAGFTPGDTFDTSHHWTSPSRPPTRALRPAA
jgi:methionyl-tRNA formyltransferase